jgi:type III secretion protein L
MSIVKVDGWMRVSGALLPPGEHAVLKSIESLSAKLNAEHASTRLRLAGRLRRARALARRLGHAQGQAAAARDAVEVLAFRQAAWDSLEGDILAAVMNGISHIIEQLPKQGLLTAQIHRCLRASRQQDIVRLYVSPEQLANGEAIVRQIDAMLTGGQCEVLAISSLRPGSCVLETRSGVIDASLNAQLRAIEDGIRAACKRLKPGTAPGAQHA